MTPDVNVRVAAARSDHEHHRAAKAWIDGALDRAATDGARLVLLPMVVTGYLRVVRIASITPTPISATRALAFVEELMRRPTSNSHPWAASGPGSPPCTEHANPSEAT